MKRPGAIASVPIGLVMLLGLLLYAGVPTASGGAPGGLELVIIFLIMLLMLALWFVGLSTAGGYLGGYLHTDSQPPTGDNLRVEQ